VSGRAIHISELFGPADRDEKGRWAQIRAAFGITAFGVNAWSSTAGGQAIISEHDESDSRNGPQQELYFVAAGHAVFTVEGDEIDAPAGTFVFVRDPDATRKAVASEPETTILAVGAPKGAAYRAFEWERGARALRHWETKDWEAAIAELSELHGRHPDDAGILYNLACAESLAGRRDDALDHLRQSVELDTSFAELAKRDSDFDSIRDDADFSSAIAGKADAAGSSS
jgi:tetratricopeptide (TPR) repeat protein